jgi:hypothetical protein
VWLAAPPVKNNTASPEVIGAVPHDPDITACVIACENEVHNLGQSVAWINKN